MFRRHLASGLGVLGVVLVTGCPTNLNPWVTAPTPLPTPTPKATLPPYEQIVRLGELSSKRQFTPDEWVSMDLSVKARGLETSLEVAVLWCDGFAASKSIDTTRQRILKHPPFGRPQDCWVTAEVFSSRVKVGEASMSLTIATGSATPTPAPTTPATPSATAAPATPTPAPTSVPTFEPISPYRVL